MTLSVSLRRAALPLATALVLVLASCSSTGNGASAGADPSDPSSGGGTVSVSGGAVTVTAADLAFDASVIEAPAGEAFTITFVNNDTVPHNISVYTEEGGDEIVKGDIIEAGQTVEVEVPAQEAGEYFFVCDLHTDMNGSVVVEA
jgi:plastocyanin